MTHSTFAVMIICMYGDEIGGEAVCGLCCILKEVCDANLLSNAGIMTCQHTTHAGAHAPSLTQPDPSFAQAVF